MKVASWLIGTLGFIAIFGSEVTHAAPVRYFLVAERPGTEEIGDSYVLPLTDWSAIFDARTQIRFPHNRSIPRIIEANIARGPNGINRNLNSDDDHAWKWHVTQFNGFWDFTAEIFDSTPTWVHFNIVRYMRETGGVIGFWNYQIVGELPGYGQLPPPRQAPLPTGVDPSAAVTGVPTPIALPAGIALLATLTCRRPRRPMDESHPVI